MLDSILTPALIATAAALVVHYVITRRSESARYPPGPLCFPLLGSLPIIIWFGGKLSKLFECCHKKYGDVSIVLYFCLLYTIDFCSRNSRLVQWLGHGLRNPKAAGLNTGHFLCCWLPQLHLYYAKLMSMQCSLLSGPVGGMDTKSNANYYHYIDLIGLTAPTKRWLADCLWRRSGFCKVPTEIGKQCYKCRCNLEIGQIWCHQRPNALNSMDSCPLLEKGTHF